ncbi:MAG TPA: hypothetical protein DCZ40_02000 [Lachnospiraceae bacterium]|nr:hypothetical protein [Lachnospiraceae bacterium]
MINFEEELKKFHPSLEVEDAEEAIYNQDLTDMADILVNMIRDMGNTTFTERPVRQDEIAAREENSSFEE